MKRRFMKGIHSHPQSNTSLGQGSAPLQIHQSVESHHHKGEPAQLNIPSSPPQSLRRALSSPPFIFLEEEVQSSQHWNEPGTSTPSNALGMSPQTLAVSFVEVQVEETDVLSPTRPSQPNVEPAPSLLQSRQTTPSRVRPTQTRGSPQRRVRPARTEQAVQQFLQAEKFWRKFKMQQHKDYMEIRREQNRMRALEVQAQRDWQALGSRVLDIVDKLVNKYC